MWITFLIQVSILNFRVTANDVIYDPVALYHASDYVVDVDYRISEEDGKYGPDNCVPVLLDAGNIYKPNALKKSNHGYPLVFLTKNQLDVLKTKRGGIWYLKHEKNIDIEPELVSREVFRPLMVTSGEGDIVRIMRDALERMKTAKTFGQKLKMARTVGYLADMWPQYWEYQSEPVEWFIKLAIKDLGGKPEKNARKVWMRKLKKSVGSYASYGLRCVGLDDITFHGEVLQVGRLWFKWTSENVDKIFDRGYSYGCTYLGSHDFDEDGKNEEIFQTVGGSGWSSTHVIGRRHGKWEALFKSEATRANSIVKDLTLDRHPEIIVPYDQFHEPEKIYQWIGLSFQLSKDSKCLQYLKDHPKN